MVDRSLQRRALITSAAVWKMEAKDAQRFAAVDHATTRAKTQKRIRVWRSGSFDGALVAAAFSSIRRLINSHYSSAREMNVISNWKTNGLKRPLENGAHGPTKQDHILGAFEDFSQWILSELCKLISGY
jgi:hypothetical protein